VTDRCSSFDRHSVPTVTGSYTVCTVIVRHTPYLLATDSSSRDSNTAKDCSSHDGQTESTEKQTKVELTYGTVKMNKMIRKDAEVYSQ
jgi:hypothetical protein